MSSTDHDISGQLAGALFDAVVSPLGEMRAVAGKQAYFPAAKDTDASTYYAQPLMRVMQPADFDFPGSGTVKGLIGALAAHWTAQGEQHLAAMAAKLNEIAEAISDEDAASDGDVSAYCYTMY